MKKKKGRGIISAIANKAIDLLPVEMHMPGMNYCGPGTKLKERLARGDKPVNKLDEFCKTHDIAYSKSSDSNTRAKADKILADNAWTRVTAPDSSLKEKAAAYLVTNLMKAKQKFFGGKLKKGKGMRLTPWVGGKGLKTVCKKTVCKKKKKKKTVKKKKN